MRLISQDGKFDIPYDEIVVELFDKCVVGRLKEYIGRDIILGSYSTESKAQKAMEMLHKAYTGMPVVFQNVEFGDDVKKMFADFRKNGIILHSFEDTESKVEYIDNVIFQFPQDEDVEV